MTEKEWLAERFEENRGHLRAVAYRMLGSVNDADDAVQESWLRLSRSDAEKIENLGGWLTTVVARVCLDMLRRRSSLREDSLDVKLPTATNKTAGIDPEQEALLADSVGLALLVVLDRLDPAERLAFVMHDMFAVPFEEIGGMVGRSPEAARQLASRARRRVQGTENVSSEGLSQQRKVIDSFLSALRNGDFEGLLAVLDPDLVVRRDAVAPAAPGAPMEVHGAREWAKTALSYSRGARWVQPVLVDGSVGAILAPHGRLVSVFVFTLKDGRISEIETIADPKLLRELDLTVL